MLLVGLFSWWYTDGCVLQLALIRRSMISIIDRFSIGLLIKTLFAPFRQISADEQAKGIGGAMGVMMDKLISRTIGFVLRFSTIIAGIIVIAIYAIGGVLRMGLWLMLPIMPIVGLIMMTAVGAPWTLI